MKRLLAALFSGALLSVPLNASAASQPRVDSGGFAAPNEPCGFVWFTNRRAPLLSHGGFYQPIRLTVNLGDGSSRSYDLDYSFYYRDEATFPWSDVNIRKRNFPVNFQFPPDEKRANEPPDLQYVMSHSTPDGITRLKKCPR